MRKLALLLAVVGAMVALTAGVALAVTEDAGNGNDIVVGTDAADELYGGSDADRVYGYGSGDYVSGGSGSDTVYAADGYRDNIDCGSGFDYVQIDSFDRVTGCEARF
jgi:Ca2+-binding RTX toxin-like protein